MGLLNTWVRSHSSKWEPQTDSVQRTGLTRQLFLETSLGGSLSHLGEEVSLYGTHGERTLEEGTCLRSPSAHVRNKHFSLVQVLLPPAWAPSFHLSSRLLSKSLCVPGCAEVSACPSPSNCVVLTSLIAGLALQPDPEQLLVRLTARRACRSADTLEPAGSDPSAWPAGPSARLTPLSCCLQTKLQPQGLAVPPATLAASALQEPTLTPSPHSDSLRHAHLNPSELGSRVAPAMLSHSALSSPACPGDQRSAGKTATVPAQGPRMPRTQ